MMRIMATCSKSLRESSCQFVWLGWQVGARLTDKIKGVDGFSRVSTAVPKGNWIQIMVIGSPFTEF